MSTGQLLRDEGMALVSEHSGEWKDRARAAIDKWFESLVAGLTFTGEDVRAAIEPVIGPPHHPNAWGAVIGSKVREWLKAGQIAVVGTTQARIPSNHARILREYKRTGQLCFGEVDENTNC